MSQALQDLYAANGTCFGCGPKNSKGLRIKSIPATDGESLQATWTAEPHHEAFPGSLGGGIAGALLDCHSNWTAAWTLMKRSGADHPPCTVTAEFHVKLMRPMPTSGPIELHATPVEVKDNRAVIEATLSAGGKVCATCRGTFVAVKPGHPAYHRW
jgi:acyl-coenzyme A thioesterase PaaI-like protein